MKFSVLVPVYNVEKYLAQCIESVLHQTYKDFELILVNDGSRDRSGEICDKYAAAYSSIKAFHKQNEGQLATRSYALKHATGDWYIFLDSDDYLQPDALETIYQTVCKYDCECVIYKWQRVCEGKVISPPVEEVAPDLVLTDKRSLYKLVLSDSAYNSLCRKACKATLFDGRDYSPYYAVKHAEDLLQSLDILAQCSKVVVIDKVLYNYTVNPQSMSYHLNLNNHELIFLPQGMALELIDRENVFSPEDYTEMYTAHMSMFISIIGNVCCSPNKLKDKVAFFKRTENQSLYKALKNAYKTKRLKKSKQRFLFGFYCKGFYRTYVCFFKLYASLCKFLGK